MAVSVLEVAEYWIFIFVFFKWQCGYSTHKVKEDSFVTDIPWHPLIGFK